MSKARLRKAEMILSRLRANDAPAQSNVVITEGETTKQHAASAERQLAALRETGFSGPVIILPDNRRGKDKQHS
jgi:hypothetical protein